MPSGSRERLTERRSWPPPGLVAGPTTAVKAKRWWPGMASDSVARWERKPHPPGQKPEWGEGWAPPGAGWGRADCGLGRWKGTQGQPAGERNQGARAWAEEAPRRRRGKPGPVLPGGLRKAEKGKRRPTQEHKAHTAGRRPREPRRRKGANYRCCSRSTRDSPPPPPPPPLVTCQCASYKAAAAAGTARSVT